MALLPTDPKRQKQVLLMAVPLVVLGLTWYMPYSNTKDEVQLLRNRLTRVQANNREAARQVREGEDLGAKLAMFEQHKALLEQLIPTSEEVPELLYMMTLRAQETNVELALMQPEAAVPMGDYTRQTYQMSAIGEYHNVARFLAEIGSLPRIIAPVDVRVQARRERTDRAADAAPRVEVSFRITTYIQPPPGTVTEPPTAAAPGRRNGRS